MQLDVRDFFSFIQQNNNINIVYSRFVKSTIS